MRNWAFAKVWNESLDMDRSRSMIPREHIWASELGGSYYDRYWKMKGRLPTSPPTLRARRKFEAGNLTEWTIRQVLARAGVLKSSQDYIEYLDGPLRVTGRCDFIAGGKPTEVDLSDLPETFAMIAENTIEGLKTTYPTGMRTQVLEIKSCSGMMFNAYERAPGLNHALQSYHYAIGMQLPAHLIYVSRDDLRMVEWVILPGDRKWDELYESDNYMMAGLYMLPEYAIDSQKESLLLWDGKKFKKNYKVEYSLYIQDYGFERADLYGDPAGKLAGRLNRVVSRIREGKELTARNHEAINDGITFCPKIASIFMELTEKL
jgi:hypothetical protein